MQHEYLEIIARHTYSWELWRLPDGRFGYVSPSCQRISGYPADVFQENPAFLGEIILAEDQAAFEAGFDGGKYPQQETELECRIRHRDGQVVWLGVNIQAVSGSQGEFAGWRLSLNDISRYKLDREAHQRLDTHYRMLAENSPDLIARFDSSLRHAYVNPAAARAGLLAQDEYIGVTIGETGVPEALAGLWESRIRQVFESGQMLEVVDAFPTPQGVRYFNTRLVPEFGNLGEVQTVMTIARDITEMVNAEQHIHLQVSALQAVANGVLIVDRQGFIRWTNPAFTTLTGYSAQEVLGKTPRLFKSGMQSEAFYAEMWGTVLSGRVWRGEIINQRKDGSLYTEEMTITPVRDRDGEIAHFVAVKQDVSERKRVEELIRVRLRLIEFVATHSIEELLQLTLDEVCALTNSAIGFFHFVEADQKTLSLQTWSTRTEQEYCSAGGRGQHVAIDEAGVWADCVRSGKPVIHNDYAALPQRKGLPPGHAPVLRELVVPIYRDEKIVAVVGVGNKPVDYTHSDIDLVSYLADIAWELAGRKRKEETLQRQLKELRTLKEVSLICSQASNEDELISRVTELIGDTFYPDHFGVLMADLPNQLLRVHPSYKMRKTATYLQSIPLSSGVSGKVYNTGQTRNIGDVRTISYYFESSPDMLSNLCAPISADGRVLGVINAESTQINFFSSSDERLLSIIANQMGLSIEKIRLLNSERERRQEAESMRQAVSALTTSLDLNEVLDVLLSELSQVLNFQNSAVYLRENNHLTALAGSGSSTSHKMVGRAISASDPLFQISQQSLNPVLLSDTQLDERFKTWRNGSEIRSWMGIPLVMKEKVIGFLTVGNRNPGVYTAAHIEMARGFAQQAAVAIENARLFGGMQQQLKRLSALRQIDQAIASTMSMHDTLDTLLEQVVELQKVDAADVLLAVPESHSLEYVAGRGFRSQAFTDASLRRKQGLRVSDLPESGLVSIPNLSSPYVNFFCQEMLEEEQFCTYAAVPLKAKGQLLGVLEVFHRNHREQDAEWAGFLETLAGQAAIAIDNRLAFEKLSQSNAELERAYDQTIEGWASALEFRDGETEGHSRRVTEMAVLLAKRMGVQGRELVNLRRGALLHDIGKIGVPDVILRKPGPLDDEEWKIMRTHPALSMELLSRISFLKDALDIPGSHHEKWDGSGYPTALRGEEIPLAARIFAIVDVWDALRSDRPYRKAWPVEKVKAYLQEQSGVHFDPEVVPEMIALLDALQHEMQEERR